MKIGFYMKWNSEKNRRYKGMIGEELYAHSMCKFLKKIKGVESAKLYSPDYLPEEKLDFMIYLDEDIHENISAHKNILYMQSTPNNDLSLELKYFQKNNYDGYLFISEYLLELHRNGGFDGIFLPFGVDTSIFYPREKLQEFKGDVAYIGNDIKGEYRTNKYLFPAVNFDFRLYGNWKISRKQWLKRIFGIWKMPFYKKVFMKICKGKIPQKKVPVLYSSAKINLNCTMQGGVDWNSTTLRPSEILACKGFLISDKMPSLEKIDDGIVFTEGDEDLKQKIRYYLDNPKERAKIAEKGYKYTIKNNKIEKRMKELYNYLRSLE
jgi:spore maturation protein CgeB